MASNNHYPYGHQGYGNTPRHQPPQYQNGGNGYVNHPMVVIPVQQRQVYNPQQQYLQASGQGLPPISSQGYPVGINQPPSLSTQGYPAGTRQPQYSGYQIPQQQPNYLQQYPPQYIQQQQLQQQFQQQHLPQRMNYSNFQTNHMVLPNSLPASQIGGQSSSKMAPEPRRKSSSQSTDPRMAVDLPAHPASFESYSTSMPAQQQYQPRQMTQSIRQPPTGSRPPSAGSRRPSDGSRPWQERLPPKEPTLPFPASNQAFHPQTHVSSASRQPPTDSKFANDMQHPRTSMSHPASVPPKSSMPASAPPQKPAAVKTSSPQPDLPVDYQVLLLALADDYISKAHWMSVSLAKGAQEADVQDYHKLIAHGLGCMHSVLTNFKFPNPRVEGRLVYRYCSLLFDETENDDVAHELLSKTVKMCERHKLVDLRYSLLHLQVRFHFRSKPVLALRMLDQLLVDIEAYKHNSWNYAMRFLRVTLSLQLPRPDVSAALQQLRQISTHAQRNGHVPLVVTSSTLETLVHLRSEGPECVQSAQRALASARMYQLDPSLSGIPQLAALLDCLDLCCDLVSLAPKQAIQKMMQMQTVMDSANSDKSWRGDGSFGVPVDSQTDFDTDVVADSGGIFERTSNGQKAMVFKWIPISELFSLGFLFSGIASAHKNSVERKAERFLEEGSKMCTPKYDNEQGPQSLKAAFASAERKTFFHQTMLLYSVLLRCNRSDWISATRILEPLLHRLGPSAHETATSTLDLLVIYLNGVIKQGTGNLDAAITIFQCPVLKLQPHSKETSGMAHELRLLATLNTVLILSADSQRKRDIQALLPLIEPFCLNHPDQSLAAAYNLAAVSSSVPALPVLKTKELLSAAMSASKKLDDKHLLCVTLAVMNDTFFSGLNGEKAAQNAKAGQTLAKRSGSQLWTAVTSGMLARTNEVCGLKGEMLEARAEGVRAMGMLHEGLRERFQ